MVNLNLGAGVLRWTGAALTLGAVAFGAGLTALSFAPPGGGQPTATVAGLLLAAAILLILGLPGMFAKQAEAVRAPGLIAHALLTAGLFLLVLYSAPPILYPSLSQPPPENLLLFVLGLALTAGLLLTGFVTLRARVFPRPAGVLILGATAGFFFEFFIAEFLPAAISGAGAAGLGLLLASGFGWIGMAMLRTSESRGSTIPD